VTTELEQAPVEEIGETTDEIDEIPEMHAHLYDSIDSGLTLSDVALCGIRRDNDPHACYHDSFDGTEPTLWTGQTACPKCGATCCATCLALA
jgi:hypothetical protein